MKGPSGQGASRAQRFFTKHETRITAFAAHPPFSGELGERIYQNVSQEAWAMYREHLKMVINEYRLTLACISHHAARRSA